MTEIPLEGGDINVVVRVGDTVRRPQGAWSPAVHSLLRWFERAGFDGAPRFLGADEKGREVLTFVDGDPGFAPVPADDDVVHRLGLLLRSAHDSQRGFVSRPQDVWQWDIAGSEPAEVVGHNDLFWTNVIFRKGAPVALIDWDLAAPTSRVLELACAASYWAPLRRREDVERWGLALPVERRGTRLRILCDAYGLDAVDRGRVLDALEAHWRRDIGNFTPGAAQRRAGNLRWLASERRHLARFLA